MRAATIGTLLLFVLLVATPLASALGLSPPDIRYNYEPGKTHQITATIYNHNQVPIALETRVTGPLAGYVTADLPAWIPARSGAPVLLTITIPEFRERPGNEHSYIYFKEKFTDEIIGTFSVRTEVGMRVNIWQPFPGSYAEITVSAPPVPAGEDSVLTLVVNNLGVEPISEGFASVRVVPRSGGEAKETIIFQGINIEGNSNQKFLKLLQSQSYEPGKYVLEGQLLYNDKSARMNGSFIVGIKDVEALGVQGDFYRDKPVNRFEIPIESLWNEPIDGVYAIFTMGSTGTRTASASLAPFERSMLSGYWETDLALQPGMVDAQVELFFPEGRRTHTFPVMFHNETPSMTPPSEEHPITISGADLLFAAIALVIVVLLLLFALDRYRKPSYRKPSQPAGKTPAASEGESESRVLSGQAPLTPTAQLPNSSPGTVESFDRGTTGPQQRPPTTQ
jgi:hypothetical protein